MDSEIKSFEQKLEETGKKLHEDFTTLRTNRPNAKLVEDIKVDYYGQQMPIKSLGTIGINQPREITITVWDKGAVGPVSKAIETSGIGMTPNVDGATIRLNLPPLTDERRLELIKFVKKTAEEAKIKVRVLRDEINKKIKEGEEKGTVSESDRFKYRDRVQKIVDKTNENIDGLLDGKIKEINE